MSTCHFHRPSSCRQYTTYFTSISGNRLPFRLHRQRGFANLDDAVTGRHYVYRGEQSRYSIDRLNQIRPELLNGWATRDHWAVRWKNTGIGGVDLVECGEV